MKMELQGKKTPCNSVVMENLSEKYGWTPEEIRKMRTQDIQDYLDITSVKNQITKANNIKNGIK